MPCPDFLCPDPDRRTFPWSCALAETDAKREQNTEQDFVFSWTCARGRWTWDFSGIVTVDGGRGNVSGPGTCARARRKFFSGLLPYSEFGNMVSPFIKDFWKSKMKTFPRTFVPKRFTYSQIHRGANEMGFSNQPRAETKSPRGLIPNIVLSTKCPRFPGKTR